MKKLIAGIAVMVALVVPVAQGGGSGGVNWKVKVSDECHKLVVGAQATAEAVQHGWAVKADRRAARLKTRARHCNEALTHIPG